MESGQVGGHKGQWGTEVIDNRHSLQNSSRVVSRKRRGSAVGSVLYGTTSSICGICGILLLANRPIPGTLRPSPWGPTGR